MNWGRGDHNPQGAKSPRWFRRHLESKSLGKIHIPPSTARELGFTFHWEQRSSSVLESKPRHVSTGRAIGVHFDKMVKIKGPGFEGVANLWNNIGICYENLGLFEETFDSYQKAIKISLRNH